MPASKRLEWFRRTTWTEADRSEFFARLNRSRSSFHKAQYLRIQAHTLGESGETNAALELLNLLVTEHPEPSQLALAYEHKGAVLRARGNLQAAIEAFAAGEQAEQAFPMMHTRCSLLLALLIVEERMVERYAEARIAVDHYVSRNPALPFPIDAYRVNVVRAALAKKERRDTQAKHHAEAALAASEANASAFARHPKLGLVGGATSRLHSWLRRWSA
jgi:tetratricopeptide (TPR) repeat protein